MHLRCSDEPGGLKNLDSRNLSSQAAAGTPREARTSRTAGTELAYTCAAGRIWVDWKTWAAGKYRPYVYPAGTTSDAGTV